MNFKVPLMVIKLNEYFITTDIKSKCLILNTLFSKYNKHIHWLQLTVIPLTNIVLEMGIWRCILFLLKSRIIFWYIWVIMKVQFYIKDKCLFLGCLSHIYIMNSSIALYQLLEPFEHVCFYIYISHTSALCLWCMMIWIVNSWGLGRTKKLWSATVSGLNPLNAKGKHLNSMLQKYTSPYFKLWKLRMMSGTWWCVSYLLCNTQIYYNTGAPSCINSPVC